MSDLNNPFHIIEPFYSSQSATSCYRNCPRQYFYQYRAYGTGLSPNHTSVPLTTGQSVHTGVQSIACQYVTTKKVDVNEAIELAKGHYIEEVKKFPLINIKDQYQEFVFTEQLALTEALLRTWFLLEWPIILQYYNILAIEQEIEIPIGPVLYQIKPDLILQDKSNRQIVNYSLKTQKYFDEKMEQAMTSKLQVSTEPYGTMHWLNEIKKNAHNILFDLNALPIDSAKKSAISSFIGKFENLPLSSSATRFCFLIKGNWKEQTKGEGDYATDSKLIYGYRKFDPSGIEYAPGLFYENPQNKSGWGRLGKGWEKFSVWDYNDIGQDIQIAGIQGWIGYLLEYHKSTLTQYILSQPEIYVNPRLQESMIRQVTMLETLAIDGIKTLNKASEIRQEDGSQVQNTHWLFDELFPQNTDHCYYPSKCDYLKICNTGNKDYREHIANDPLNEEFGAYRRRIPHHEPEKKLFEKVLKDGN
jgi:hypothetical protein